MYQSAPDDGDKHAHKRGIIASQLLVQYVKSLVEMADLKRNYVLYEINPSSCDATSGMSGFFDITRAICGIQDFKPKSKKSCHLIPHLLITMPVD